MLKRIIFSVLAGAVSLACQEDDLGFAANNLAGSEVLNVEAIAAEDLPVNSQAYINENFSGELVTSAYRISTASSTSYETYLTNDMNLLFGEDGHLEAFGEAGSLVDCGGNPHHGGRRGSMGPGGHHGPGHGGTPPDTLDGERPPRPTELTRDELPAAITDYLDANYVDNEILAMLYVVHEDTAQYHILIAEIGAAIFDSDGNFIELRTPRERACGSFEEMAIEELSATITDYIALNYPDHAILKARTGTRDEVVEIHVLVEDVGALIFDQEGNFIELKTCGMNRG